MRILAILLSLMLLACAGDPPLPVPALRVRAESANRAAIAAAHALHWDNAIESWREALLAYQSLDDWGGQGRVRLGLAQAYVRNNQKKLAGNLLAGMPEQSLFSAVMRAQAAYQQALLASTPALARERLGLARDLCGKDCSLNVQFDNLAARLALASGNYVEAQRLAVRALAGAKTLLAEQSHAHRLLAEVALAQNLPQLARQHIEEGLWLDRQLAEPAWLLEDYRIFAQVALRLNDQALIDEISIRQASLCSVVDLSGCGRAIKPGNP